MGWSKKEPRWQQDKKSRRASKMRGLLIVCLVFVFLIFLAGFGYKFSRLLSASIWDGKGPLNLVWSPPALNHYGSGPAGGSVLVTSFDPKGKSLNILVIPQGTLIETIKGYGAYRVEAIYQLDKLEKQGGELLKGSLREELGIPIEGYIQIFNFQFSIFNEREAKESITRGIAALLRNKAGETDLSQWDLVRLWWFARSLREDKIKIVDLAKSEVLGKVSLADGSQALKIDPVRLEIIIQPLFVDKDFRQEGLSIAVANATEHFGLAGRAARLIKNIGGRIVEVGDREKQSFQCEIRSPAQHKNSYTVKRLKKIFDCLWGGENLEGQRAEVVVILGLSNVLK